MKWRRDFLYTILLLQPLETSVYSGFLKGQK